MRRILPCLLLALLVASWSSMARATVAPPISIEFDADVGARAGQPFTATLILRADEPVTLGRIEAGGGGWPQTSLRDVETSLAAGETLEIPLRLLPTDAQQPLRIALEVDGRAWGEGFLVSAEEAERAQRAIPMQPRRGQVQSKAVDGSVKLVEAVSYEEFLRLEEAEPTAEEAGVAAARTIRVRGRLVYTRDDNLDLPLDDATIIVYDRDTIGRNELATGRTNQNGNFDVSFTWDPCGLCEAQPDIFIQIRLENDDLRQRKQTIFGAVWKFEIGTYTNYSGTDLNIGTSSPSEEKSNGAYNIFTTSVRARRWFAERGWDLPFFKIAFPSTSQGAYYTKSSDTVHLPLDRQWRESTIVHEFGHHVTHSLSKLYNPSYCNGICDDPQWWEFIEIDCGHCFYCEENGTDAWSEGFADWLGVALLQDFENDYGVPLNGSYNLESRLRCSQDNTFDPPLITEGAIAGFLLDLTDADADNDPNWPTGEDLTTYDGEIIIEVLDQYEPRTVQDFLDAFLVAHPSFVGNSLIWGTAANNGYDFDELPPSEPGQVTCTSHDVGVESPDATLDFTWNNSTDDWSGVDGFYFTLSLNFPISAPSSGDLLKRLSWSSEPLDPGSYYFNIRAVDNSGKLSDTVSIGPFVVREPNPVNLVYDLNGGWGWRIVPRPAADVSSSSVPLPSTLTGGGLSTWWNLVVRNEGDSSTGAQHQVWVHRDGSLLIDIFDPFEWSALLGPTAGTSEHVVINRGPVPVGAGRHTFGARIDAGGLVAETDEVDNNLARQWVWEPTTIASDVEVQRPTPPVADGGWDWIPPFYAVYSNVDGVRFESTSWWNAFVMWPVDNEVDYDAHLHEPSTGAMDGFQGAAASSGRGAGCLDAVFVNRNAVSGVQPWDVGVEKVTPNAYADYRTIHVENRDLNFGTPTISQMVAFDYLHLWEVYVGSGETGAVTIDLERNFASEGDGPLYMAWFDRDFTVGGLLDGDAVTVTGGHFRARLNVQMPDTGYYGLAVWRDPKDGSEELFYDIKVSPTLPDMAPWDIALWPSSIVPRQDAFFYDDQDPTPTSPLPGDVIGTRIGTAVENLQPVGTETSVQHWIQLDGENIIFRNLSGGMGPNEQLVIGSPTATTIPAGRHTLSLRVDGPDAHPENDEGNNKDGSQWVWEPPVLASVPVDRAAPPNPRGGFGTVPWEVDFRFNRDGIRTPVLTPEVNDDGRWHAVAAAPRDTSDVDITLYETSDGPRQGFDVSLAWSGWGRADTDFVIVDLHGQTGRSFDAGFYKVVGEQDYTVDIASSVYRGSFPGIDGGPFTLGAGRVLELHEIYVDAGSYRIDLSNLSGNADLGISAYAALDGIAFGKSDVATDDAISWFDGEGADESVEFTASAAGYHVIAVWKTDRGQLPKTAQYALSVEELVGVAAPDASPVTRTALTAIQPNPFNPRTTVHFEVAEPGPVDLTVYNLRGERVQVLTSAEHRAAGRYEAVWDGTDESGRRVASGIYLVLLEAVGSRDQAKLTLVK